MQIETLSIEQLADLRHKFTQALADEVAARRKELWRRGEVLRE
jgi:hypothetical protein